MRLGLGLGILGLWKTRVRARARARLTALLATPVLKYSGVECLN